MTTRRVVKRFLLKIRRQLPVVVDQLECGHLMVDPGAYHNTRLCRTFLCSVMSTAVLPGRRPTVHLRHDGQQKTTMCGKRRLLLRGRSRSHIVSGSAR